MTSSEISMLAHGLLGAKRIFEEKTEPFVEEWAQLRVKHLDLLPSEASRDFHFVDLTTDDKGLIFESEDWEETWQYGGYEKHYGRTITIPFDFFDNPQPYRDEAEELVRQREQHKIDQIQRDKANRIKDLERQLAKARKEG